MRLLRTLVVVCGIVAFATPCAVAQQYITDDAAITEYRACQLQLWYGERSAWVLPVGTPIKNLEFSAGLACIRNSDDSYIEWVAQAKLLLRSRPSGSLNIGLVVGTGRDPAFLGSPRPTQNIYAYVPLTRAFFKSRLTLHHNTGWLVQAESDDMRFTVTWAAPADVMVVTRLVMILDTFGATTTPAEFQIGLRSWIKPNRVQVELSYGGCSARERWRWLDCRPHADQQAISLAQCGCRWWMSG